LTRRRMLAAGTVVAALLVGAPVVATAAADDPAPRPGAYDYPVRPGSDKWKSFTTHEQMQRATQLPKGHAARMSTEDLAATVLDYPLLLDAVAHNDVQRGMETVTAGFNGLQELLRREDSGKVLLTRYRAFDARVPANASLTEAGEHTVEAWKLEMLLAQPQVLKTLSPKQLESVLRTGADTAADKKTQSAYGHAGLEPTAVLLGRALALREGWDWKGSMLLREAIAPSATNVDEVLSLVKAHFAEPGTQHRASADGDVSTQDYYSHVRTPRGTRVRVIVMTYQLSRAKIRAYNRYVARNYPRATRETNASRKYNCHSYAWYSGSTSNNKWMNDPGDNKYWRDGSYSEWHTPYIWFGNMKLSWKSADHSGRWIRKSDRVRSKWGQLPRMNHYWKYSPYSERRTESYFRNN
ncbi:MAG: hypothetical protein ACRDUA_06285, partial [Micromonosporaceae bacterium]